MKLTDDMKRLVVEQRLGYIATVCPDGTPNLSPKGTITVWDDEHLVFADIRSPGTIANLQRNSAVEINVVNPFSRKGYRFKGKATVWTEGPHFQEAVRFYDSQGLFDAPRRIKAVVLVEVEHARPLISPGYDRDVEESQVSIQWKAYYLGLPNAEGEREGKA